MAEFMNYTKRSPSWSNPHLIQPHKYDSLLAQNSSCPSPLQLSPPSNCPVTSDEHSNQHPCTPNEGGPPGINQHVAGAGRGRYLTLVPKDKTRLEVPRKSPISRQYFSHTQDLAIFPIEYPSHLSDQVKVFEDHARKRGFTVHDEWLLTDELLYFASDVGGITYPVVFIVNYQGLTKEQLIRDGIGLRFGFVFCAGDENIYGYDDEALGRILGPETALLELGETAGGVCASPLGTHS